MTILRLLRRAIAVLNETASAYGLYEIVSQVWQTLEQYILVWWIS